MEKKEKCLHTTGSPSNALSKSASVHISIPNDFANIFLLPQFSPHTKISVFLVIEVEGVPPAETSSLWAMRRTLLNRPVKQTIFPLRLDMTN